MPRRAPVVIWSRMHNAYWRRRAGGYTNNLAEAGVYSPETAARYVTGGGTARDCVLLPLREELRRLARELTSREEWAEGSGACPPVTYQCRQCGRVLTVYTVATLYQCPFCGLLDFELVKGEPIGRDAPLDGFREEPRASQTEEES